MCLCLLLNANSLNVFASQINSFYIRDDVGCISSDVKEYISKINTYYESTEEKPQVVVEILNSLEKDTIESYAVNRFEDLELGSKDMDNGVLLVVSVGDRQSRIEVGYGLEGALTDSESNKFLSLANEYFKAENYSEGVKNIFSGIVTEINKEYNYTDINVDEIKVYQEAYPEKEYRKLTNTEKIVYSLIAIIAIYLFIKYEWFRDLIFCMIFQCANEKSYSSGGSRSSSSSSGGGGRSGGGGSSSGW